METSRNVLITGATGFIGQALHNSLKLNKNITISTLASRKKEHSLENPHGTLPPESPLYSDNLFLQGIDTVIHLAGRAHVLKERSENPLNLYRRDNVDSTLELAKISINSNVRRFIFISSIGVNGPYTHGAAFCELSPESPVADYAISKWEAEQQLHTLVQNSKMELVIIRPPLVYAGHAPGNFQRLMKLIDTGIPLPFASTNNARSMIALENLVDFITLCIYHQAAANETFLIADDEAFSTTEIVRYLASGMSRDIRFIPLPKIFIKLTAKTLGMQVAYHQLFQSLIIDSRKAQRLLGWKPPLQANKALFEAGLNYKKSHTRQDPI
ncbi:NAD-dependent epimerase/dehydratase family protein [Pseudomonas sp. P66]|uniref:NAD-dependent epimerase/dehydratase family protein n=1 Tax=Pseudomonas arcuscaelestis TaxID=2710591 RepID=A0ABS2C6S8_9PSED|nr:NAD-dependent epimerase/dehydratase family protein [Pseudomonas arcuscaelestis]MBM5461587.1 NAD-dependent epimerase/dehydratase family protein [Pseudomonas arcuscaelestis]